MEVLLHPRYAPKDRVRVWLGVRPLAAPPAAVRWAITLQDGSPVPGAALNEIRPLQSARNDDLLGGANPPRVFTGVYEFTGLEPDKYYAVRVEVDGPDGTGSHAIVVRTLPDELPGGTQDWFHVLLVSCYHYTTSPPLALASVLFDISKECRPSLSLLLGDQVYLDLPTIKNFPPDRRSLAARFEVDYARNWFEAGRYREVLAAAPGVAIADDHEYWNNYPHVSPIIQNSWKREGRAEWTVAARAMFAAFQAPDPDAVGEPVVIDVPPVSIFMADTRTFRDFNGTFAMTPGVLNQLGAWVDGLNAQNRVGIFVTGQSIFDAAADEFHGSVGDRALANYGDFAAMVGHLTRATAPLICVTGDVHWGRVIQVRNRWQDSRLAMYEVITSPASLVETVGADQWKRAREWLGGLFGGDQNPWPRHSPPDLNAAWRGPQAGQFEVTTRHGQTGDQVAVLSLRRFGDGVQARVGFYAVHADPRQRTRTWSEPFDLSAGIGAAF